MTAVETAVRKLPASAAAALAAGASAVPVLDCTAIPGMMVRRCYDDGTTLKCSSKEHQARRGIGASAGGWWGGGPDGQVGVLVAPVGPSRWLVRWADGTSAVYQTGAGFKFQLSYVTEHPQAGAPFAMPRCLDGLPELPVLPAFECCTPFSGEEGALALVGGQALLLLDEADKQRLLAAERVPLSYGTAAAQIRYYAGGLFRIYELSHAAAPGQAVTVFTAREGLRVALQSGVASSGGATDEAQPPQGPPQLGTLARPVRLGAKALDDHLSSLASSLGVSLCALNATAQRLTALWLAAAECEPAAPYRVAVRRLPMHGDTVLLSVGPAAELAGDGPVGPLGQAAAQQLLDECAQADTELARAAAELQAALRGAPHFDLDHQRAADRAAAAKRATAPSRQESEDGGGDGLVPYDGPQEAVDDHQGRWILKAVSYEDAVADAELSLTVVAAPPVDGSQDGGGGGVRLEPSGKCSIEVAAAVARFNSALEQAEAALEEASTRCGLGLVRYQVEVLPRPPASAMPLRALRLGGGGGEEGLQATDPLLVQEMIETFHSYSMELVINDGSGGDVDQAAGGGGKSEGRLLGPLAMASLDLAPEMRAVNARAHEALNAYGAAQAAGWRRQIGEMYGDEGVKGEAEEAEAEAGTLRGAWNGIALAASSPPLLTVQQGVNLGDVEGLVRASEDATSACSSQAAARLNDCLLQLWRCAGKGNGGGGSAHVADGVVKVYRYLHEQIAKAVSSYGVTFMVQDAGVMRQKAADAAAAAVGTLEALRAAADAAAAALGGGSGGGDGGEDGLTAGGGGAAAADDGVGALAEVKQGVAQVRRVVSQAVELAGGVAVAATTAATAADEQSCKDLAAATAEELLQVVDALPEVVDAPSEVVDTASEIEDAAAAAAVASAARWAAAAADSGAAAAEAAAAAAGIVAATAAAIAEAGGAATVPAVLATAALAAGLVALARSAATAAQEQQSGALLTLKRRMDAAAGASDALGALAAALSARAAALEEAAAGGAGDERLLVKTREELAAAQECAAKHELVTLIAGV
ncbi:hypothetical protein TSOC_004302 [Tetrabaena socialis]|uniref:Uncharacterized protein n=1 Tax=Tetrabaena socialis TaxID=47790 RepID=A0A2J8A989_9CHLO|nr:hypothetical protein TSOC_004302 [Tetrabaena socialis]|eukprot:PNH09104.1 hypothetical protein TSOC_004302 [Tetrabaena socialis]